MEPFSGFAFFSPAPILRGGILFVPGPARGGVLRGRRNIHRAGGGVSLPRRIIQLPRRIIQLARRIIQLARRIIQLARRIIHQTRRNILQTR